MQCLQPTSGQRILITAGLKKFTHTYGEMMQKPGAINQPTNTGLVLNGYEVLNSAQP